ncbi:hypothetical protein B0T24DRAFT_590544 [Lasiosphaeria ovina]|uniref:Nonsense-mediated mRNA decay factor n=1 Tax=Lasiosphaeria ovina TaxID=92902 RepID=A0AAE0NEI4_9PEZI|nr:hypothetical protein B0T24DRAFT_590544 [Lasiosphaeria ovina]
MATTTAEASVDVAWKSAHRLRGTINKELDQLLKNGPGANETLRFDKVEKLMQNFRLACIKTIWLDIRAADEKGVESNLWATHNQVTKAYRKVLGRLHGTEQVVLRRKIEKLYLTFIKTAQYFYKGFLQRACARCDIKDLKRIAHSAGLEDMPVPDEDKLNAADAKLVTASCHKTLVHLGDLSRYRTLMRSKERRWDIALAYYALANELIPESGLAHHQCGVIYDETKNHLELVYHLYCAMACAEPHPNAPANLEREFRDLREQKAGSAKGATDALVSWFVKLHAFYFKGEEFPGRKELESEVDHRLAMAMKSTAQSEATQSGTDMGLLKMVLININAYVIGFQKITVEWTDAKSRSCQFILLMNIRTIHTLSRLLREELVDLAQRRDAETTTNEAGPSDQRNAPAKFSLPAQRILPLLRVYIAWLLFYGRDLVAYQEHLEPHFGTMCRTLGQTLSHLVELLGGELEAGNRTPWRFEEDKETLGMGCLNGPDLPSGCPLYYDPSKRTPKPRADEIPSQSPNADDLALARGLDIVSRALDLADEKSRFPLAVCKTRKGSHELTTFEYLEGGKPEPVPQAPTVEVERTASLDRGAPATLPPAPSPKLDNPPQKVALASTLSDSEGFSDDEDFYVSRQGNTGAGASAQPPRGEPLTSQAASTSEFSLDSQLYKFLNDLVTQTETNSGAKPTRPMKSTKPPTRLAGLDESSYGMGSTTAGEVYGGAAPASPAPGSATAKAIPNLPWEYFYPPESNLRASATGSATGVWGADGLASSRPVSSGSAMQPQGGIEHIGDRSAFRNAAPVRSQYNNGSVSPLLMELQQALQLPAADYHDRLNQSLHGNGIRGMWAEAGAGSRLQASNPANGQPPPSWTPPGPLWQQGLYGTPGGRPSTKSPFSSPLAFSPGSSSLPQVNSPWGLAQTAQGHTLQGAALNLSAPTQSSHSPGNSWSGQYSGYSTGGGLVNSNSLAYGRVTERTSASAMLDPYSLGSGTTNQFATDAFATAQADEFDRQARMSVWTNDYRPKTALSATLGVQQTQNVTNQYQSFAISNNAASNGKGMVKPIQKPATSSKSDGRPKPETMAKR